MHCTTLHAGLLSAWHSRGQVLGACPQCQAGCDGRRGWGTPAGLPQSARGEGAVRRWRCQVGTAPAGAELGSVSSLQLSPTASAAAPGQVPAVLCCNPRGLCSRCAGLISRGGGSGSCQPQHSPVCWGSPVCWAFCTPGVAPLPRKVPTPVGLTRGTQAVVPHVSLAARASQTQRW